MTIPTLTIRKLAQAVMLPGQDEAAVAERLRNWTKEGLIKTAGPKHTGSGHARSYPPEAVFRAAILNNLTCYFGVRATVLAPALDRAWKQAAKHDYFAGRGMDLWLLIGAPKDAGERTELTSAIVAKKRTVVTMAIPANMSAAVVMINLSLLYDPFREHDDASGVVPRIGRA
jgi:hypothetical protein